ncbi:hypothetical protein CYCD_23690 [Tenuifilaceae bacterium CYCD]|nr:hypothetical protein CYCD_23690 [Tenuifilaceae bacterium CYCD]
MRTVNLDNRTFYIESDKKRYLLLGDASTEQEPKLSQMVMPKINKVTKPKVTGLWGTLGNMNDTPINWRGTLKHSEYGNDSSVGVTHEEIELIYAANPQLDNQHVKVTERFISFEDVEFDFPERFTLADIPKFRLTLMLDPDEGALVYYQYNHADDKEGKDDSISYILPEKTSNDFDVANRDRLTYLFDALPPMQVVEDAEKGEGYFRLSSVSRNPVKFLIKILTYKRGNYAKSDDVLLAQVENIKDFIEKPSRLLIFDNGAFKECQGADVNTDLKTLLLIHGTFGTTNQSFGALVSCGWLQGLLTSKKYEQIIAFDHPTVFKGASQNIDQLLQYFNGMQFSKPVDVIGTSQGGLLAQYLANMANPTFTVGKVVLVASANGVDYVTVAGGLSKLLSVLKVILKGSKPALAFICNLAQHSVDFIIKQPGLELMDPKSPNLAFIMDNIPVDTSTRYLPVVDDFTKEVVKDDKLFVKLAAMGLDLLIRSIMGKYNDWVVRTENQFKIHPEYCAIPAYDPKDFLPYTYAAIHGHCLDRKDVQEKIDVFL